MKKNDEDYRVIGNTVYVSQTVLNDEVAALKRLHADELFQVKEQLKLAVKALRKAERTVAETKVDIIV